MGDYVSICVTALDRKDILEQCLCDLRANTSYPYELIVNDDGSHKETRDFLVDQLSKGRLSRLILNPCPMGLGDAADNGYRMATGKYVVKLDGDEQFSSMWLTKAVRTMELFPEIRLLHTSQMCNHRQGKVSYPEWDRYVLHEEEREGHKIAVTWMGPGADFLIRKETYDEFGPWYLGKCPSFSEDMFFRARVCPMARYWPGYIKGLDEPSDLAAHWEKYKNTPWMAAMDPPVTSYHRGEGKSERRNARSRLLDHPLLYELPPVECPKWKERGDWFD